MSEKDTTILLRVNRQETLHQCGIFGGKDSSQNMPFLREHFIPLLFSRGYSTSDLLQALGGWTFNQGEKITAHLLWDAAYINAKP